MGDAKAVRCDAPMVGEVKPPPPPDPYEQAKMFHALNKRYEDNGGSAYNPLPPVARPWEDDKPVNWQTGAAGDGEKRSDTYE